MRESTRRRLARVGEVMSSGGYSLIFPKPEQDQSEQIVRARGEFMESVYPKLFGHEEMGDPARLMTPAEVTAVLVGYEAKLATDGLLKIAKQEV